MYKIIIKLCSIKRTSIKVLGVKHIYYSLSKYKTMITQEWATNYCRHLMSKNNLSFPFRIGRKKNWGGIDAVSTVTDENSFFRCYKEFDEHPRCVGIFIIKEDNILVSI